MSNRGMYCDRCGELNDMGDCRYCDGCESRPPEVPEGEYDRAIAALAFWILPKWATWCALSHDSRSGASLYYGDGEPKATEKNPFGELHNWTSTGRFGVYKGILRDVENLPDWRTSLRRVEKGWVVQ